MGERVGGGGGGDKDDISIIYSHVLQKIVLCTVKDFKEFH